MFSNRRQFFLTFFAIAGILTSITGDLCAQKVRGMPSPPPPSDPTEQDKTQPPPDPQSSKRAHLLQNEKDFRAGIDRLFRQVNDLHAEVVATPTAAVLSMHMLKEMESVEKLAKQLKNNIKG
jgi:hypothetical protein